jgi:excinuclease ABC subunit C
LKTDPRPVKFLGVSEAPPQAALPEPVQAKLESLPATPGCYIFRDRTGQALYIGKAKSLRARVRSYFQEGSRDTRAFIPLLVKKLGDLETLVTATEKEAAILENSLIKEQKPRYNVKLRDDKEYLTLRLSVGHEWPRLELVRRPTPDQARYFGPYHSATAARRTLHLVEKHFQLRTCSDRDLASRTRPCLQYQIKRCPGPCVFDVDHEAYAAQVRAVTLFLDGRHDELSRELEERMSEAASRLDYELAARYRDQLAAVKSVREEQRVVSVTDLDQDVVGLYREADLVELGILLVRHGRVVDAFSVSSAKVEIGDDEVVAAFLRDYYGDGGAGVESIPDEILVGALPEGSDGVGEWLGERSGRATRVLRPARGPKKRLLELATENAHHAFKEKRRAAEDVDQRLRDLAERLRLPTVPRRIECTDISHLGGEDTVGVVVGLSDGVPDKRSYRTYHLGGVAPGDDYAALRQLLERRFRRGAEALEGEEWELPDLFVVDGGRGQLGVALTAAGDLGLHDLPIVGLAKERESPLGDKLVDRVYLPGQKNPIPLRPSSPELFILARARDEAHRFSNRGRQQVGKKRRLASELDQVKGIGPKTRKALLAALGSVAQIRAASDEEILSVPGLGQRQLAALRAYFSDKPP